MLLFLLLFRVPVSFVFFASGGSRSVEDLFNFILFFFFLIIPTCVQHKTNSNNNSHAKKKLKYKKKIRWIAEHQTKKSL